MAICFETWFGIVMKSNDIGALEDGLSNGIVDAFSKLPPFEANIENTGGIWHRQTTHIPRSFTGFFESANIRINIETGWPGMSREDIVSSRVGDPQSTVITCTSTLRGS